MLNVIVPVLILLAVIVTAVSLFSVAKALRALVGIAIALHGDYRRVHREVLARPALRD